MTWIYKTDQLVCVLGTVFLPRQSYKDNTEFPDTLHSVSPMLRAYTIRVHSSQLRNQHGYMTINQTARLIHIPLVFPSCCLGSRNSSRILHYPFRPWCLPSLLQSLTVFQTFFAPNDLDSFEESYSGIW